MKARRRDRAADPQQVVRTGRPAGRVRMPSGTFRHGVGDRVPLRHVRAEGQGWIHEKESVLLTVTLVGMVAVVSAPTTATFASPATGFSDRSRVRPVTAARADPGDEPDPGQPAGRAAATAPMPSRRASVSTRTTS